MYVHGHHVYQSMDQPSKVANPTINSGQLNKEKIFPCPRACLRTWSRETGSAVPSRVSLLISILRLNDSSWVTVADPHSATTFLWPFSSYSIIWLLAGVGFLGKKEKRKIWASLSLAPGDQLSGDFGTTGRYPRKSATLNELLR